jgi:hypothetical protein
LQGRGSSPTSSTLAPTLTWRKSCRGGRHRHPAPPTVRRRPERNIWTSPSSAFRPSTPAPEHPLPQAWRAPPTAKPQALGSPAAKEPRKPAMTERQSPAERRPRVPTKAPAMTRTPRRTPSKLSPRTPPKETVLAAHSMTVRHCPAGPFLSCNHT